MSSQAATRVLGPYWYHLCPQTARFIYHTVDVSGVLTPQMLDLIYAYEPVDGATLQDMLQFAFEVTSFNFMMLKHDSESEVRDYVYQAVQEITQFIESSKPYPPGRPN